MNILVTGASSQLAQAIKEGIKGAQYINATFKSSSELDITNAISVQREFVNNTYDYCINCAAYTQVDKAETELEKAQLINVDGVKNLAISCFESNTVLFHISTDFIFNGTSKKPYLETDAPKPLSIYGQTKFKGEKAIKDAMNQYFILRTSWLYSEFGHNFMKTMLRLGNERKELSVVTDQIGTPTYAGDLAATILAIINANSTDYGVYHYSNEGSASWFDFAKAIFDIQELPITLNAIKTEDYPQPATRPKYSVLDKTKIKETFKLDIPYWEQSLKVALRAYAEIKS